jgi:hypothetical protein
MPTHKHNITLIVERVSYSFHMFADCAQLTASKTECIVDDRVMTDAKGKSDIKPLSVRPVRKQHHSRNIDNCIANGYSCI